MSPGTPVPLLSFVKPNQATIKAKFMIYLVSSRRPSLGLQAGFSTFLCTPDENTLVYKDAPLTNHFLANPIFFFTCSVQAGEDRFLRTSDYLQDISVSVKGPFVFPILLYLIAGYLPLSQLEWNPILKHGQRNSLCFWIHPTRRWSSHCLEPYNWESLRCSGCWVCTCAVNNSSFLFFQTHHIFDLWFHLYPYWRSLSHCGRNMILIYSERELYVKSLNCAGDKRQLISISFCLWFWISRLKIAVGPIYMRAEEDHSNFKLKDTAASSLENTKYWNHFL